MMVVWYVSVDVVAFALSYLLHHRVEGCHSHRIQSTTRLLLLLLLHLQGNIIIVVIAIVVRQDFYYE